LVRRCQQVDALPNGGAHINYFVLFIFQTEIAHWFAMHIYLAVWAKRTGFTTYAVPTIDVADAQMCKPADMQDTSPDSSRDSVRCTLAMTPVAFQRPFEEL
jgi:hypothetical protein